MQALKAGKSALEPERGIGKKGKVRNILIYKVASKIRRHIELDAD